ncbi:fatty acid desaturase [Colletotrichum sp. SAR 10_98]|nr:fatty acid desaturase [Colletotrichum sp. SAR 10_98]
MNENILLILSRRDVEALIAHGRKLFILDDFVIKADSWIAYHPGGDKSILHMVGRDATDEQHFLWRGPARWKSRTTANASSSSSVSSVPSTHADDDVIAHLDFVTKQKISIDLETYPSLDHATQDAIVAAYRRLDDRLRAQGLYDCSFRAYAIEVSRYTMLFAAMLLLLHWG